MVREVVNCLSFVILKERVKLNPYISFFTLQFGKYQQFWKVHNFLYLFGEKKKKRLVFLCPLLQFFVKNTLNLERSDFQKHMVHTLHVDHLGMSFLAVAGGTACNAEAYFGGSRDVQEPCLLVPAAIFAIWPKRQNVCSPVCRGCLQLLRNILFFRKNLPFWETHAAEPIILQNLSFDVHTAVATESVSADVSRGLKVQKLTL